MQKTFKASARTLDMLGRQQIAGRPTAISELFKNAHDAYADKVEVDYYKKERLFVLRDNGYGMTYDEFVERWLTIGTQSRLNESTGVESPYIPPKMEQRPILGEKGIGRLAIAAIGPQVLVLTRAKRINTVHSLISCYIHWGFFEIPGISLEDVQISILEFKDDEFPNKADVDSMLHDTLENLEQLKDRTPADIYSKISADIEQFRIDPSEIDSRQDHLSLQDNGCGTHFIINPTVEELIDELKPRPDDTGISEVQKALLGFSNTMTPDHKRDLIATAFRYHKSKESYSDIIAEYAFFSPEYFKAADHHITGSFDKCGKFTGSVRVYGTKPDMHIVPWPEAGGKETACGPFNINFAVVQGRLRDSLLGPEEHTGMTKKLDRIGGLYIYNDNIRVLPYGDTDYDFLEIEKRRTLGAGYYFFSYRRIFGVIELSRKYNPALHEKAGREGFRENTAYKQFKAILMNFFVRTAAEFFRETGAKAETWAEIKTDLKEEVKRKREESASVKRQQLEEEIGKFYIRLEEGVPQADIKKMKKDMLARFEQIKHDNNLENLEHTIIMLEKETQERLRQIEESYLITKPKGVGLSKASSMEYMAYTQDFEDLVSGTFKPAKDYLEVAIDKLASEFQVRLDKIKRAEALIHSRATSIKRDINREREETQKTSSDLHEKVRTLAKKSISDVNETINTVLSDIRSVENDNIDETALLKKRTELDEKMLKVFKVRHEQLENVRAQLEVVSAVPDQYGRIIGSGETTEVMEEDLIAMQEEAEADIELIQIGNAISIIQHEFNQTVHGVRNSLKELAQLSNQNVELKDIYLRLNNNFGHLDGYLKLLSPFLRRRGGLPSEIKGTELVKYLKKLFSERMKRHEIILNTAQAFGKAQLRGYLSIIYPAFVNLIDNAIFWLKEVNRKRTILLDYQGGDYIIADTGPGVPRRSRDLIFDRGYSLKPGGLGLGLYISRRALQNAPKYKYELLLGESAKGDGAKFIIRPLIEEIGEGE